MKQIFLGLALSMLVLGTAGQGLDNITAFSPSPLVLSGKSQFASVSFTYNGDLHQYPMEQMSQDIFDKFFQEISFCMIPFGAEYTDDQHGVWYFIVLENCDMEAREVHLSLANAELSIIQHSYYAPNIYSVSGSTFKSVNTPCTVTLSGSQSGVTYTLLRDGTPVGSKTGTGSALNFTNVHDFGDYTVRAANDHNLTTLMDGVAKVYPIINVYSLSGGGSLTIESGLPLSLSGSQSGIVYNLLKDNTLVNTRNGTGTAITFTVNEPGSYRVQAIHKERVVAMNGVVTVTLSSSGAFGITGFSPSTIEIPMFACILQIQVSHAENMPTITSYEMLEELSACLTSSDGITLLFISFTGNHSGTLYLFVDQNDTGITRAFQLAIPYKATLTIEQTASTDFKVFTLSGGGNISDNTGCDITLSGSQAGVTYKLLKNGNICNTLLGTGLPLVFTGIYTPGIYTVQAQAYTNNGEYTCMMAGSATVYVQLDSYTLSGGGNITNNAPNVTLALSGSQAGVTYKLLRHGESHATRSGTGNALEFTVNLPGEYSVMAITSGDNLLMNGTALVTGKIFSKNKNYTVTTTYLDPTTTTAAPRSIVDVVYTNGHGQPVQEVMVAAAPGGKDIVRPVEHARFGREERIFLPYSAISGGGTFLGNATDTARWAADYGNEEKAFAYTRVTYDDSPLNRVIGQIGAGKAWHVARKGITTTYMTNTANEVPLWRVNENGELSFDGHYPAGTLLKEAVTDEDGNAGETFKDKEGNVVLSARYDNANDNERHVTCNVYDDFGLLRYVLPPAVADASDLSMETIDEYCYAYKHDEKKRLIEKKLPGVAPVYMLYDARDRLALSQDGNQRAGNEWLYTLYDTFNRVVESGTCVSDAPVESLRATVGTSCNYIPGTRTALLENFYDHYGPEALPFEAARDISGHADGDGNPNGYHDLVASMITTTRERVLDDDGSNWVTTTCYYDNELRIIQVKRQYPANRVTVTGNRYDFTGNVLQAKEWQTTGGTTVSMEQEFTRDARGRSLSTRQRVNDGEWVTVNELEHDGLGRLAAKRLHGGIDSIAYAYNARGWTTGIHGKNFKETLHYTGPPAALGVPARYNGNIAATTWQHGTGERQAYGYDYDGLDRLANAHHGRGTTTVTRTNEYSVTGITHDKNGNILTLSRRANGNTVDDLAYRYSGNQLMNVHDASGHAAGYDNTGALTADRYLYDANGNMTRDLNNGITAVSYNFLNLPRQVTRGGQTMKYVYTATGTKLRNSLPGKTLDYIGSFVYEDGALSYILTGEGRYVVNGSTGTHEYNLADHLGNVRAVIDQEGNVIQATSYYPFGMPFTRAGSSDNKYLYNGKEEQEETGWLDYGARMYDATIGRWFNVDPMAESYYSLSPYAYCVNNPLLNIDPTGMAHKSTNPNQMQDLIDHLINGGNVSDFDTGGWNEVDDSEVNWPGKNGPPLSYYLDLSPEEYERIGINAFQMIPIIEELYALAVEEGFDGERYKRTEAISWGILSFIPYIKLSKLSKGIKIGKNVVKGGTQLLLKPGAANLTQKGLDHIIARHGFTSGAKGAGKFAEGTTEAGLKSMINTTTTQGVFRANTMGRAGTIAEYNFGRVIGTTSSGAPASSLRVVIGTNGNVITAFPF